ncbi:MAG: hypothetical protein J6W84_04605 [Bacteroidales bacterium]|nr:hypothetical protein [Bacteroidales bacterium]
MNRIILIGNGFDLAHGLKTSYADFIKWYWNEFGEKLSSGSMSVVEDRLCSFKLRDDRANWLNTLHFLYPIINPLSPKSGYELAETAKTDWNLCNFTIKSLFFEKICEEVETKNWVDIEDVYYEFLKKSDTPKQLNEDLDFIKDKLVEYLSLLPEPTLNPNVKNQIWAPINREDISVESKEKWKELLQNRKKYDTQDWDSLFLGYKDDECSTSDVEYFKNILEKAIDNEAKGKTDKIYSMLLLPDNILLLNFNYTNTADLYLPKFDKFQVNHIHGSLSNPESVIFGYGDERDDEYQPLMKKNDNEYLRHIKSFHYLESSDYRNMLGFIEEAPFQICIMGHSCGISDRTLLKTLFEHKNCVSIKPYYYRDKDGKDNYFDLICNIARNISDPRLMRDRVVGKEHCQPLG